MNEAGRYSIPRLYYLATPAFILLDYFAGVNAMIQNERNFEGDQMTEAQEGMTAGPEGAAAVELMKNLRTFKNGANWFYWIAGLSIVNSVISLVQGNMGFIFGLGITQIADMYARGALAEQTEVTGLVRIIALGASVFFAGFFALFGWLANQRQGWALLVGMVLYLLDGLVFLLVQDWVSLAFHGFALYWMFQGYTALRKLKTMLPPDTAQQPAFGPNA